LFFRQQDQRIALSWKVTIMARQRVLHILLLGITLAFYGCDLTDPDSESPPNSTTVDLALTNQCAPPTNPIACENAKGGNPTAEWEIDSDGDGVGDGFDDGDPNLQGFATDISVNRGETVHFKVKTTLTNYHLDIYRLGSYGGAGARKVATVAPSVTLPQDQPPCTKQDDRDPNSELVDCGTWHESASWTVPSTSTSGIYIAKLVGASPSAQSHIIFVVRDDSGHSDILFQTSDTTWQAYNSYSDVQGAQPSLYTGGATKVSYNRPFNTRGQHGVAYSNASWLFAYEYPMIRWLEANGYDVSYSTGVDTDRRGADILKHKVFISVGHDEYWSANQRANVEAARAARVHLAFFSGNEMAWKTRWESSIDGSGTLYRTLVCYKESEHDITGARTDPDPAWTGSWRDPTFSPPSDGGRPANSLTGTNYAVQVDFRPMTVPWDDSQMRLWRNTAVARGSGATLRGGCDCLLGHEWDEDSDNGFRPPGLIRASTTTTPSLDAGGNNTSPIYYLLDHGSDAGYRPHVATHHLTLYRNPPSLSGALVFGAGTIAWSWGLDNQHDIDPQFEGPGGVHLALSTPELAVQQATVNLFADMCDATGQHCVQPRTLQPGLVAATASIDSTPPASVINSPTNGASVAIGSTVSIAGTATDSGGGKIGGVEVSVDDGATWHPATGHGDWSYSWKPTLLGAASIRTRAVDDTGNLENPVSGVNVTVVPGSSEILLFYNQTNGNNAIGRLTSFGNYVNLSAGVFSRGWTHIVTGTNNVLFFYNTATGYAWTGKLDDAGNYTEPSADGVYHFGEVHDDYPDQINARSPGWTHIVAGANNLLLFYNSYAGNAVIGKLDDYGSFVNLSARQLPAGWTNIVAGVNNVFFFYDRNTGRAATAKMGIPAGSYADLKQITGVAPEWTHIVVGVNNVLLFFKANPGNAMSAKLDDAGNLTVLRNPLWNADLAWTSIAAGMKNNVLLFYHSPSGTVATGSLDANGNYVHLANLNGFSLGWTHIIGP
jgi:hypothetical protein